MQTVFPNYLTTATVGDKADKVQSATSGNFAGLDGSGNLIDSGHKHSDYITDKSDKADKVGGATNGHFAGLDGNGNLTDSGKKPADYVEKVNADQWVNGGTTSTKLGVACATANHYAFMMADSEGGNFQAKNGNNLVELDGASLLDNGTGTARILVKTGSADPKIFKLQQDGNFVDGNNNSTGGLNRDKLEKSEYAIVENTDTATHNIQKGQLVLWHGVIYYAKSNIASGTTLNSTSLLNTLSNGGANIFTRKKYSGTTGTTQFQNLYYKDIDLSTDISTYGPVLAFYVSGVDNNHPAFAQRVSDTVRVWTFSSGEDFNLFVTYAKCLARFGE